MSETNLSLPYENIVDLARLTEAGSEFAIMLDDETRARIAEWAGIEELPRFDATIALKRLSRTRFAYTATFDADVVQSCVVTLEPVQSHVAQRFTRALHLLTGMMRGGQNFPLDAGGLLAAGAGEDDAPEEIADAHYDIAASLLEEFALALDPYPRAPGVEFTPPAEEPDPEDNPFTVLQKLKLDQSRPN